MACYYLLVLLILTVSGASVEAHGKLSSKYYSSTCPEVLAIVEARVRAAIKKEARMGASLLRLHFHDCFVNGCDGSILLDDNANFIGEKTAAPNNKSVRGFDVVDDIKSKVEKACPGVVSCADILAIAARDSTVMLGGPSWKVKLGRRDSTTASRAAANNSIPAPTFNISRLLSSFAAQGLSLKDLVALSGSHTIGLARCTSFRTHIYNDSNIDASFAKSLQRKCPKTGKDNVHQPLDFQTPTSFDNLYFHNLLKMKGLLRSDQELFNGSSADCLVKRYAADTFAFFQAFAKSMIKMGNIKPLTGRSGEIRTNCRKVNRKILAWKM
ncbi:peroxidase P7-like [Herrania umbratica]|uniref:Peroxidase n=1 Tax=Herrania umbratica TaxID=108875 RepID=A0A6J1BF83_9ROSI|nr:peroxidase P7-like [Herrania umbratica]